MDTEVSIKNKYGAVAIWAITPNGTRLGQKILDQLTGTHLFVLKKHLPACGSNKNVIAFQTLAFEIQERFSQFDAHVFIFSSGIAVRMIAPLIKSKLSDPAVVVMDEKGDHIISLLSGHIGGANALSEKIAKITGGTAVITTATDKNKLPAIDMIAKSLSFVIETPENIKKINAAFLENRLVKIVDDTGLVTERLEGCRVQACKEPVKDQPDIYCSWNAADVSRETLILRPRLLHVGIGCNRGTPMEEIKKFLEQTFEAQKLSISSIAGICTTDVKKDETGLTLLAEKLKTGIRYYTKEQLNAVDNVPTPSKMVQKHLGVKSVCEASAILSSKNGRLIVTKKKNKDVTIAVAVKI